jgi:nicotinamide-nucleotide amidase
MERLRASILTIGTEVSTGQIVNTNASWLADQLVNLKIDPLHHLTVPDTRVGVMDALHYLASRSDLLFVTGGLGPTADDITRQLIAEWCDDQLVYDEASWQKILQGFARLGATAAESNRQQCWFPSRGRIITNPAGTANAFFAEQGQLKIWCLPGPPEEIKAIWKNSLHEELSSLAKGSDGQLLFRWQCLGQPEAALGELVESIIIGTDLISGYRPHLPYVEVKVWCLESRLPQNQAVLDRLDIALAPWLISRNDEDFLSRLFAIFRDFRSVHIVDQGSYGAIAERLGQAWAKASLDLLKVHIEHRWGPETNTSTVGIPPSSDSLALSIGPLNDQGEWTIEWWSEQQKRSKTLKLPFRRDPKRFDRERRFVCEMSLASWSRTPKGELHV